MRTIRIHTTDGLREFEVADDAVVPTKVSVEQVVHTGSNNRVAWVGKQVVVTLSDGSTRRCQHTSGHRSGKALFACSTKMVDALNREAGLDPRSYKKGA